MQRVSGQASPRIGLLGNPSDGYEGKAIALTFHNFSATVTIEASDRFEIVRGPSEPRASLSWA